MAMRRAWQNYRRALGERPVVKLSGSEQHLLVPNARTEAEMATIIEGGILGGDRAEIARGVAELQRREAAAVKLAAEQALKEQEIEQVLSQTLHAEIGKEIESQRLDAKTLKRYREDFARFRKYCETQGLPCLPAGPQVTALFLGDHCEKGLKHFNRLRAAIACTHRIAGFPDPCEDLLVRAIGRLLKENKSSQPATPAQH
jgi:hypothetical protein